jgi:hypothetical protein
VKITLAEAPAIRMLHRAMLEGDAALAKEIQRHAGAHATQIGSMIAAGVASGAFRAELDPRRAVKLNVRFGSTAAVRARRPATTAMGVMRSSKSRPAAATGGACPAGRFRDGETFRYGIITAPPIP